MQLSIALEFDNTAETINAVFSAVKNAGFYGLSWANNWAFQIEFYDKELAATVAAAAAKYATPVTSLHGYSGASEPVTNTWELSLALNVNRLEFMQRINCPILVVHNPPVSAPDLSAAIASTKDYLERLLKYARPWKQKIALENLFYPKQFQQIEYFDALFNYFAPEDVGFCFDSGHAIITGYPELVTRYRDRLFTTHLHDNDADWQQTRRSGISRDELDQHRQPGTGNCNWAEIITALKPVLTPELLCLEITQPSEAQRLAPFLQQTRNDFSRLWQQFIPGSN